MSYGYPLRYLCSALEEMRSVVKYINVWNLKRNKILLCSLIEEVQVLGNRMEAALEGKKDLEQLHMKRKSLNNSLKASEPLSRAAKLLGSNHEFKEALMALLEEHSDEV